MAAYSPNFTALDLPEPIRWRVDKGFDALTSTPSWLLRTYGYPPSGGAHALAVVRVYDADTLLSEELLHSFFPPLLRRLVSPVSLAATMEPSAADYADPPTFEEQHFRCMDVGSTIGFSRRMLNAVWPDCPATPQPRTHFVALHCLIYELSESPA